MTTSAAGRPQPAVPGICLAILLCAPGPAHAATVAVDGAVGYQTIEGGGTTYDFSVVIDLVQRRPDLFPVLRPPPRRAQADSWISPTYDLRIMESMAARSLVWPSTHMSLTRDQGGLPRHVHGGHGPGLEGRPAHLVELHLGRADDALGAYHHRHVPLRRGPDGRDQRALLTGEVAGAEALQDDPGVGFGQVLQDLWPQARIGGEHGHILLEEGLQQGLAWPPGPGRYVPLDREAQLRQRDRIDRRDGLDVEGGGLLGPGPPDHLVAEDDHHLGDVGRRHPQGVDQVAAGIGADVAQGDLSPREDHRLRQLLQHEGDGRRGVTEGVGTMGDDEAVVVLHPLVDGAGDLRPEGWPQVARVDAGHREDLDLGQLVQLGERPRTPPGGRPRRAAYTRCRPW